MKMMGGVVEGVKIWKYFFFKKYIKKINLILILNLIN
jgi:hypothetical protein